MKTWKARIIKELVRQLSEDEIVLWTWQVGFVPFGRAVEISLMSEKFDDDTAMYDRQQFPVDELDALQYPRASLEIKIGNLLGRFRKAVTEQRTVIMRAAQR